MTLTTDDLDEDKLVEQVHDILTFFREEKFTDKATAAILTNAVLEFLWHNKNPHLTATCANYLASSFRLFFQSYNAEIIEEAGADEEVTIH
jgi:hypothetical protein